jgi:hypothetical protein
MHWLVTCGLPVDSTDKSFGSPAPVNCQLVAEEEIEEVMKVPYATNQPTRQPQNRKTGKQENRAISIHE